MSIYIKSEKEIQGIRISGRIVAETLEYIKDYLQPETTLTEIENLCAEFIIKHSAIPAFKGYHSFPANVCISVNNEVVHGIPNGRKIKPGDLVKIDVGVLKDGFYADGARTFPIGNIDANLQKLLAVTEKSLYLGIDQARDGNRLGDISSAIQQYVETHGFSVVRELTGHGVGIELHEEPLIPNFGLADQGIILQKGMTLAIEPMVNIGSYEVLTQDNKWTVVTKDGLASAHFEHTILVTDNKPEILTRK
ncbi:MAG: type I methionyl aminopeptidase [Candidatus Latescibacteria bacterium]|nr:type I methionyl aminopeptidase [Candidatus Latescibacterota bacterium]